MSRSVALLFALFCSTTLFAQLTIVASVDKNPVRVGEAFELKYTVLKGSAVKLVTPPLSSFVIINGPNSSEAYSNVAGVVTITGEISYTLKATKEGTFTIAKAILPDSGKIYSSEVLTLVVTEAPIRREENVFADFLTQNKPDNNDSLYFKDGTVIGGKAALIKDCVQGIENKKKGFNGINVEDHSSCKCILETIAKHYTYQEYADAFKNIDDIFSKSPSERPEAFKEMVSCVIDNMKAKESNKKSVANKAKQKELAIPRQEEEDKLESFYIDACEQVAAKTKEYKQMTIDAHIYCKCTWDKIKEKGLSLNNLGDLSDPNSKMFNEIITPCLMESMKKETNETDLNASDVRNPNDIVGDKSAETVPLTKLMKVYKLKVSVGGIEKYFTLDSGANDVFINSDFERELLLEGLIKKADYLPTEPYRLADGTIVKCRRLKLNNIQIGGFTVNNVVVAINDNSNGLLLLGKSLLDKFSGWKIDNRKEELILSR